ncbi:INO80 complex subunit C [Blattella germanica]|nr:INO80 complex subunit C [Blattella germanica]
MVKRKRPNTFQLVLQPLGDGDSAPSSVGGSGVPSPATDVTTEEVKEEKRPIFKASDFQHSSKTSNKKRAWRSLKQIITQERSAKYTDPQTKLYYALAEEFSTIRSLPMDIAAGYLALRRANNPMG